VNHLGRWPGPRSPPRPPAEQQIHAQASQRSDGDPRKSTHADQLDVNHLDAGLALRIAAGAGRAADQARARSCSMEMPGRAHAAQRDVNPPGRCVALRSPRPPAEQRTKRELQAARMEIPGRAHTLTSSTLTTWTLAWPPNRRGPPAEIRNQARAPSCSMEIPRKSTHADQLDVNLTWTLRGARSPRPPAEQLTRCELHSVRWRSPEEHTR
jgi:hypothetical protein